MLEERNLVDQAQCEGREVVSAELRRRHDHDLKLWVSVEEPAHISGCDPRLADPTESLDHEPRWPVLEPFGHHILGPSGLREVQVLPDEEKEDLEVLLERIAGSTPGKGRIVEEGLLGNGSLSRREARQDAKNSPR